LNDSAPRTAHLDAPAFATADLWWTTDDELIVDAVGSGSGALSTLADSGQGVALQAWLGGTDGGELAALLSGIGAQPVGGSVEVRGRRCHLRLQPRPDGKGWGGALFDLSDEGGGPQRKTQQRQHQRLEVIGTLASGVAHEINNPIQSIMNYAQLIRNRSQDERLAEYAKEILYEAQRVAGIVKNLLFFARQEGQPYAEAYMAELVEQTLSLTAAVLRREQVVVDVDVSAELPAVVCHPQQVQQVIMNLVTNARDALNARYPKGDDNKRLHIGAHALPDGRSLRTTIEDQGGGMAADDAQRLFDPERLKLNHGSGLGLSVCYAIVEDHGGSLAIETEEGSYTRIHLDLPIATN